MGGLYLENVLQKRGAKAHCILDTIMQEEVGGVREEEEKEEEKDRAYFFDDVFFPTRLDPILDW